jgi:hypothetical protein
MPEMTSDAGDASLGNRRLIVTAIQQNLASQTYIQIMSTLTPIGSRMQIALDAEYLRMVNEWFFKWHHIGRDGSVQIDSFDGRTINYGGMKFSGTARSVYWATIQRYARQKVGELFNELEVDLQKYPIGVREKALNEARTLICQFVAKIRRQTVEKDKTLRGDGINFPKEVDLGNWAGALTSDIEARVGTLHHIFCNLPLVGGGFDMPFDDMMNDRVTLVKKDGSVAKDDIKCLVTKGKVQIHDAMLPIEVGDHILRKLPNGFVEDYLVEYPQLHSGAGPIKAFYIVEVRRTDIPAAQPSAVIQRITAHVSGPNSRLTIGSDNSVNSNSEVSGLHVASFLEQLKSSLPALPDALRVEIAEPIALLEEEIRSGEPHQGRLRGALQSMKSIAEGATGNLVAAGIAALIGRMLGVS